jgi:hypothetical protein
MLLTRKRLEITLLVLSVLWFGFPSIVLSAHVRWNKFRWGNAGFEWRGPQFIVMQRTSAAGHLE